MTLKGAVRTVARAERGRAIRAALKAAEGNIPAAAAQLRIHPVYLYRLMAEYGIPTRRRAAAARKKKVTV